MGAGPAELLPIALIFWALPIVATVWALLTLARVRTLLERIADRLDALAARDDGLRPSKGP